MSNSGVPALVAEANVGLMAHSVSTPAAGDRLLTASSGRSTVEGISPSVTGLWVQPT